MKKLQVKIRLPLPRQTGGAQGTEKGKRGYDRRREKESLRRSRE
ncbi:MAG: hypothetical protein Q7S12_02600 [bacterium]|nr:hypothetical protein [bacterium]